MPSPALPVQPSRGFEITNTKKVLVFDPDVGDRQTRVKSGRKRKFEFVCDNRKKSEYDSMSAFWDANYPGVKVSITHPYTSVTADYWLDSDLKEKWSLTNLVSFSFVAIEA